MSKSFTPARILGISVSALALALAGCKLASPTEPLSAHSGSAATLPQPSTRAAIAAQPAPDFETRLAEALSPENLASVTADRFPDADSAAVIQWEKTRYAENGTYVTEWVSVDKTLTERGLEDAASVSLWNNDFYGSLEVLAARIHSPDGTVRDVDLATNLAEAVDTSSLKDNIHDPNDKDIALSFPRLEVGDTTELRVRRTISKPRVEGVYSDYLTFEQTGPILWQGARIEGPVSMPLRSRAFRDAGPVELQHWCETNAAAGTVAETWVAEDVPRYFPESDMPPAYSCTARLLLSTAPDWESLSRWYAKLCAPHLAATNAAMAALAAERIAGLETRDEKIAALFDFVSREVRYMGAIAESEAPGYEPHDVSLTFDNRYGVCRDKAALLVALLRMADVDAWPTLVHVGPRKDRDVPQPYFNHAIVAAATGDPDRPYELMDPTSETTRSLLPEYLCEKSYLVAREDGETIRETPPLPVEDNLAAARTKIRFDETGTAAVDTKIRFTGINDIAWRGKFATLPRDGIRALCQRLLATATAGAVLTSWSLSPAPEQLRSDRSPLVLRLKCEMPGALAAGRPSVPFDPPRFAESLSVAARLVDDLGLQERRFPLETEFPCGYVDEISFDRPPAPRAPLSLDKGGVSWEERLDYTNLVRSLRLSKSSFSPSEYLALRASAEISEKAETAPLFFAPPAFAPAPGSEAARMELANALGHAVSPEPRDDIYLESQHSRIDLSDLPQSWSVVSETRVKLVTYAGRRSASDRTFLWQPAVEDFEVLDARTISPDGTETPVDPALDIFVGDQPWVAAAPRYPAGKITTVSFPKAEPGATLCCTVKRTVHNPDFFAYFAKLGSLSSFGEITVEVVGSPQARAMFELRKPRSRAAADSGQDPVCVETAEQSVWTVRGGGPESALAHETNMPSDLALFHRLEASGSDAVSRAEAIRTAFIALSDPTEQTNAAALALSLVSTNAPTREKILAIRDWTDLNIRDAGPDWTTLPLSRLSSADATLAARYGHYADRRILALAMARALGLEPDFVFSASEWTDPGEENPLDLPISPGSIASVQFAFHGDGGERLVLSGSSRYAPAAYDPLADLPTLTIAPDGSTRFRRPPSPPDFANDDENTTATEIFRDCTVRPDGSARVRVRLRYRGAAAESFRRDRTQMLPEERRRDAQQLLTALSQGARAVGPVEESFTPEGPCELAFTAEVPDFAVPTAGGDALALRIDRETLTPETAPRIFPFARNAVRRSRTCTTIRAPEGWTLEYAPTAYADWTDPEFGVALSRRVATNPEPSVALRVDDTLCLGPAEFAPDRYPEFLSRELSTRGPAATTAILRAPRTVTPNAPTSSACGNEATKEPIP